MSYILATAPITTNTPISTTGTDHNYVELYMRRLGAVIELRAIAVEYNAFSGRYLRDELGCELVGEEEAIDAAVDLHHLAYLYLDAQGNGRGYSTPSGFGEAVEKALDTGKRQDANPDVIYQAAAE
jgi:hypothetical protein